MKHSNLTKDGFNQFGFCKSTCNLFSCQTDSGRNWLPCNDVKRFCPLEPRPAGWTRVASVSIIWRRSTFPNWWISLCGQNWVWTTQHWNWQVGSGWRLSRWNHVDGQNYGLLSSRETLLAMPSIRDKFAMNEKIIENEWIWFFCCAFSVVAPWIVSASPFV